MNKNEILKKYAKEEDFKDENVINDIIQIIGFNNTMELISNFPGVQLYFPNLDKFKPILKRYFEDNQDKSNFKISKELDISRRTLQRWKSELFNTEKMQKNVPEKRIIVSKNIMDKYFK